jgi:hypothetical protein
MNDARLRALYALVLDRPSRALTFGRLSIERLLALVERRGPESERLWTLDHAMGDRDHMLELDILRAAAGVRRPTPWLRHVTAAAAVIFGGRPPAPCQRRLR